MQSVIKHVGWLNPVNEQIIGLNFTGGVHFLCLISIVKTIAEDKSMLSPAPGEIFLPAEFGSYPAVTHLSKIFKRSGRP